MITFRDSVRQDAHATIGKKSIVGALARIPDASPLRHQITILVDPG
jgi:hypothetical protein